VTRNCASTVAIAVFADETFTVVATPGSATTATDSCFKFPRRTESRSGVRFTDETPVRTLIGTVTLTDGTATDCITTVVDPTATPVTVPSEATVAIAVFWDWNCTAGETPASA